jgi:hypothetical protein
VGIITSGRSVSIRILFSVAHFHYFFFLQNSPGFGEYHRTEADDGATRSKKRKCKYTYVLEFDTCIKGRRAEWKAHVVCLTNLRIHGGVYTSLLPRAPAVTNPSRSAISRLRSERCQLEKLLAIVGLSSLPHSPLIKSNLQQINKHQLEGDRDRMEVHTHHLVLFIDLTSRRPTGAVVPAMKRTRNEVGTDPRHRRIGNQPPSSVLLSYVSVVKGMSRHVN